MRNELTEQEVVTLLRELLADIFELTDDVGLDEDLAREREADSLQWLELMSEVEHRLGIRIDARAWRSASTLAGLAELTLSKLVTRQP